MTTKFDCEVDVHDHEGLMYTITCRVTYSYVEDDWMDSNGEGVSPSMELEYDVISWYNEDGLKGAGEVPHGIDEADVFDAIEREIDFLGI